MKMTLKTVFIFLFLSLLIIRPTSSYAHWRGHTYVNVSLNSWSGPYYGAPYYYPYYDPFYDPYYYPYHPYYVEPYYYPEPVVVASSSYQPIVVNGATYYVNNGIYYIYTPYGYQAVATPAGVTPPVIQTVPVTTAPASTEADSITINVPNNKGGYTAVFLRKSGNGYVGPQGEYYPEFPTVAQLQKMYGK